MPITRRIFLLSCIAAALNGCVQDGSEEGFVAEPAGSRFSSLARTSYGALPDEPFPIPAVDLKKLKAKYRRRVVDYPTTEIPGTIIVDTPNRFLYLVLGDGKAMRYGVGIGRDGFTWGGRGRIQYKRSWPRWIPPNEMIARQPELEKYRTGMEAAPRQPARRTRPVYLPERAGYALQATRHTRCGKHRPGCLIRMRAPGQSGYHRSLQSRAPRCDDHRTTERRRPGDVTQTKKAGNYPAFISPTSDDRTTTGKASTGRTSPCIFQSVD